MSRAWFPSVLLVLAVSGCGGSGGGLRIPAEAPLLPSETFRWCPQPISFSPPPSRWYRQGDGDAGMQGVRFILSNGGGQCISVLVHRVLAERDRKAALRRLIGRVDSLERHQLLRELSLVRPRTDDLISEREAYAARQIDEAIDRAVANVLADEPNFVASNLQSALHAASSYQMTLEEALPRLRLQPERKQEPFRWRIGYGRDTVIAGHPAFASDDTLITPERPLLYHEVLWVVNGYAFKAVYQGAPENLGTFHRVLDTVGFPPPSDAR
jgi:hypothetical protein